MIESKLLGTQIERSANAQKEIERSVRSEKCKCKGAQIHTGANVRERKTDGAQIQKSAIQRSAMSHGLKCKGA